MISDTLGIRLGSRELLAGFGYCAANPAPGPILRIAKEACGIAESASECRGAAEIAEIEPGSGCIAVLGRKFAPPPHVSAFLGRHGRVAVIAVTAGPGLDLEAGLPRGILMQTMLDRAGSLLAEKAFEAFAARISGISGPRPAPFRAGPGLCGWPLSDQGPLLSACGAHAAGISENEAHALLPRKSITAIIGVRSPAAGPGPEPPCRSCPNPCGRQR